MAHSGRFTIRIKPSAFWQSFLDARVIEALLPACRRFSRLDEREYEGIYELPSAAGPAYASIWAIVRKEGAIAEIEFQVIVRRTRVFHASLRIESQAAASGMRIQLLATLHDADPADIENALAQLDAHATAILWRLERVATGGVFHSATVRVGTCRPAWTFQATLGLSLGLAPSRMRQIDG